LEISNIPNYHSVNEYGKAVIALNQFTKCVLTAYAECSSETRDRIIRDFISRSVLAINGMIQLWLAGDYHDCWLVHRAILDRLFYLESIGRENKFQLFDDWSFVKRFKYKRKCLKDEKLIGKLDSTHFIISDQDKKRYEALRKGGIKWRPPKAYEVASSMNLDILYDYGYDFGSMYVHPLAVDGEEACLRLAGKPIKESFDDQITVIHNSCLVIALMIKRGLFFSQLEWRSGILGFIDDFNRFLSQGSEKYVVTLLRISKMMDDNLKLCRIKEKK
jgi:hypothetical protein